MLVYSSFMDRTIKVIGEKEERARALLRPIEKEVQSKAFKYFGITSELYYGLFFAHMQNEGKLGAFIPSDQIIILSEELLDYPVSVIKNVYLHECAHAIDYLFNPNMTGHSPFFREICEKLGIEKGFEKARLKEDLASKVKAREKLDKLMALSSSSFENEALVALEKARKLIEKAALSEEDTDEEKIYRVDVYEKKRISTYILYITIIVSENTGIFFVKNHNGETVTMRGYGSLEQCESALYLFDYLLSALENEVKRLRKQGKNISKDSFMVGAYRAIKDKSASSESTAVVRSIQIETKEKAKRIAFKDSSLHTTRSKIHLDSASFSSGSSFGKELDLSGERQKRIGD